MTVTSLCLKFQGLPTLKFFVYLSNFYSITKHGTCFSNFSLSFDGQLISFRMIHSPNFFYHIILQTRHNVYTMINNYIIIHIS